MSAPVMEGNDAVTGHIISTTIGGKNGEPKRVSTGSFFHPLPLLIHLMAKTVIKPFFIPFNSFYSTKSCAVFSFIIKDYITRERINSI